jgi:hypothetical protein
MVFLILQGMNISSDFTKYLGCILCCMAFGCSNDYSKSSWLAVWALGWASGDSCVASS